MACCRPGDCPHLFCQLCAYRRRKGEPKSFSWADYRDLIIATHPNLSAPLVWCWDNLNIHLAPELADFAKENRAWLRVYQLPASAPDLNPAEGIWPLLKRAMANFAAAASGIAAPGDTANLVTDSDLVAVSLLGIRVTGYEALIITQYRAQEIAKLLSSIPVHARIDEEASAALLTRDGPAWRLWELLFEIKDRTKDSRFGGVAAGKLLARKRPGLIPIEDSRIAGAFRRKAPDRDESWWDDVRAASLDPRRTANGTTLWDYLANLRSRAAADHLPVLRVLDIIGWMHARYSPAVST